MSLRGDQSEDKDSNGADNIPDPNGYDGIPTGEPLKINNDGGPSNMDEEMSDNYFAGSAKVNTTLSTRKNKNQIGGPTREFQELENYP